MIQNVTNFARGVGKSAEKAISYFGNSVSNTTRLSVFGNLTGNSKKGRETNNTLKDKQTRALRVQNALILFYDNYQKGLQLQHQHGTHSSTFFKGTHQCAHTVFQFENLTFDKFHALFTQHEQAIPSPWGMPVYEIIAFDSTKSICDFIVNYENYEIITSPDFIGQRFEKYIEVCDIASHLQCVQLAFLAADNSDQYFTQCPSSFDRTPLNNFTRCCNSKSGSKLFTAAKNFQRNTNIKWNENANEVTLTMFLGLIGIDESASKECGAITTECTPNTVKGRMTELKGRVFE